MNELLYRSASEATELVQSGKVSSRELTEAVLARIDAVNPSLNAVVELRAEAALKEAAAADAALEGRPTRSAARRPDHDQGGVHRRRAAPGATPRSRTTSRTVTRRWSRG